jgi:hypothetical protein
MVVMNCLGWGLGELQRSHGCLGTGSLIEIGNLGELIAIKDEGCHGQRRGARWAGDGYRTKLDWGLMGSRVCELEREDVWWCRAAGDVGKVEEGWPAWGRFVVQSQQ